MPGPSAIAPTATHAPVVSRRVARDGYVGGSIAAPRGPALLTPQRPAGRARPAHTHTPHTDATVRVPARAHPAGVSMKHVRRATRPAALGRTYPHPRRAAHAHARPYQLPRRWPRPVPMPTMFNEPVPECPIAPLEAYATPPMPHVFVYVVCVCAVCAFEGLRGRRARRHLKPRRRRRVSHSTARRKLRARREQPGARRTTSWRRQGACRCSRCRRAGCRCPRTRRSPSSA